MSTIDTFQPGLPIPLFIVFSRFIIHTTLFWHQWPKTIIWSLWPKTIIWSLAIGAKTELCELMIVMPEFRTRVWEWSF